MIGIYFSGTGNTKYCIEKFLSFLGNDIPIISIEDKCLFDEVKKHSEIILAYPIYFSSLPKIVKDFIVNKKEVFKGKKVFIIATMGLFSGDGTGCSARLIKNYGAQIVGGLHLKMPDCIADVSILKRSFKKNKHIIEQANKKIKYTALKFKAKRPTHEGLDFISHIAGLFAQRLWFYKKTMKYTNKIKIDTDKCVGCNICGFACPMKNLKIVNDKAVSKGKCTMCYRCINNCPQKAITLLGNKVIYQGNVINYL